MKKKDIIKHIIRDEMPDTEQTRQNIHQLLDHTFENHSSVSNTTKPHTRMWVKRGLVTVMVFLIVFAMHIGMFDFGIHEQPDSSDPGIVEPGSIAPQPQKRGFMLLAYAAEMPESEASSTGSSPDILAENHTTVIKRGINGFLTMSEWVFINYVEIPDGFEEGQYILCFDQNNSDVEKYAVKGTENAAAFDSSMMEKSGDGWKFRLDTIDGGYSEGFIGLDDPLAVVTNGVSPAKIMLEVTFTDGEIESYTLTITPHKENDESPFVTFEISLD